MEWQNRESPQAVGVNRRIFMLRVEFLWLGLVWLLKVTRPGCSRSALPRILGSFLRQYHWTVGNLLNRHH